MDILELLSKIKDPAFTVAISILAVYINKNFLRKDEYELRNTHLETRIEKIEQDYVSREKLRDALETFQEKLNSIVDMIKEQNERFRELQDDVRTFVIHGGDRGFKK